MQLNSYIDHTILKPTTLVADIEKLCKEAMDYQFAAVCVPPNFVKLAKSLTVSSKVKVATVIGFPFGYSAVESKIAEIVLAMVDGADDLDMVCHSKHKIIKVIIEIGVLTNEEIIACCDIYGAAGIDYLKTSTGYAEKGATVEVVKLFRLHLPEHVQIKASGGIRDYAFAKELVDAGATRLGCSAGVAIVTGAPIASSNY
ncbi:MAG: deoxyribose-phosphate aldolase [Bacteroidetes bacterium]|nr:deoxyribose-phosphate aldolase [Bacteroidota bacterium]